MPKIIVIGHGTPIVKVIVENVVTCFLGHSVCLLVCMSTTLRNLS